MEDITYDLIDAWEGAMRRVLSDSGEPISVRGGPAHKKAALGGARL